MGKANTAANAALYYEAGQTLVEMAALTDDGGHKKFVSGDEQWSERSGYEAVVRPDGLATGGAVTPTASTNDSVDVAALTCYAAGALASVAGSAVGSIERPAVSPENLKKITSIVVTAGALAAVAGIDGAAFISTRDAAGGPPLIPVGSIEIAQVRLSSSTPAQIAAAEIFQVVGTHCERYDYPIWEEHPESGCAEFASALPAIHEGSPLTYKGVYAEYYTPDFTELPNVSDFVPPENAYSISSVQVYGGTVGAQSASLGQGSFKAMLKDGITDNFIGLEGENLWFKFFPDRNKAPYKLCQGFLGIGTTYPPGASIAAACTISARTKAQNVSG